MKYFILLSVAFLVFVTPSVSSAQTLDSVDVAIDANIPLIPTTDPTKKLDGPRARGLFKMFNNRTKTVESNTIKNTVVDVLYTVAQTGNTALTGRFVRENGNTLITCFVDKQGTKHLINAKSFTNVGQTGVILPAFDQSSDFKGAFVREQNNSYITAYVDVDGRRWAIGADAASKVAVETARATAVEATKWGVFGNSKLSNMFLGTLDSTPLVLKTLNIERARLGIDGSFQVSENPYTINNAQFALLIGENGLSSNKYKAQNHQFLGVSNNIQLAISNSGVSCPQFFATTVHTFELFLEGQRPVFETQAAAAAGRVPQNAIFENSVGMLFRKQ